MSCTPAYCYQALCSCPWYALAMHLRAQLLPPSHLAILPSRRLSACCRGDHHRCCRLFSVLVAKGLWPGGLCRGAEGTQKAARKARTPQGLPGQRLKKVKLDVEEGMVATQLGGAAIRALLANSAPLLRQRGPLVGQQALTDALLVPPVLPHSGTRRAALHVAFSRRLS